MPDHTTNERFHELLSRFLEDETDAVETREFTKLVKSNPDFSDELRVQLLMDSRLAQYENESHGSESFSLGVEAALDAAADGDAFVDKVLTSIDSTAGVKRSKKVKCALVTASLIACVIFAFVGLPENQKEVGANALEVAKIQNLVGKLDFEGKSLSESDSLRPGIIEVDGYVVLEFYKGARLTVAGPARLELVNPQRAYCHFGKLRANVPAQAKGFTIATAEAEIVDLGTEFAMEVDADGQTEVHVFVGEVEAYDAKRNPNTKKLLTAGRGLKISGPENWKAIPADASHFKDLVGIRKLSRDQDSEWLSAWKAINLKAKSDSRLIAYYDFELDSEAPRILVNRAKVTGSKHDGAIVGARWTKGPWKGKRALDFKQRGDRVRINLTGEHQDITLAAWVRVDGFFNKSSSALLVTDSREPGHIHWQLSNKGALFLGLVYKKEGKVRILQKDFIDPSRLSRWYHIATVFDGANGTVSQYLNGNLLGNHQCSKGDGRWTFGDASIANWDHPGSGFGSRSLNGAIAELMIFNTAIDSDEIKRFALK